MTDPNAPRSPSDSSVTRFMLDTNVFDRLEADRTVFDALVRLVTRGRIEVLVALPQLDELLAIKDDTRRQTLFGIRDSLHARQARATQVAVPLTKLRLDSSSEFAADYAALQGSKVRDTADIAIATAAKWEGAWFVSDDKRMLRRIDRAVSSIWTMSYGEFAKAVLALDANLRYRGFSPSAMRRLKPGGGVSANRRTSES